MALYFGSRKVKELFFGSGKVKELYYGSSKILSGDPYNDALALVGLPSYSSVDALLADSAACTALSGNADASMIMKENYRDKMESMIDTAFNAGLNLLNYTCGLDFYLYAPGDQCEAVSGGWSSKTSGSVHDSGNSVVDLNNNNYMRLKYTSGGNYSAYGYSPLTFYLYNNTKRDYYSKGYREIAVNCKLSQNTGSYNMDGAFSCGTTVTGDSTSYSSLNDSTAITIKAANMEPVIHDGEITWDLGGAAEIVTSFRCTPKYQYGAFGGDHDLIVYSVKVCR